MKALCVSRKVRQRKMRSNYARLLPRLFAVEVNRSLPLEDPVLCYDHSVDGMVFCFQLCKGQSSAAAPTNRVQPGNALIVIEDSPRSHFRPAVSISSLNNDLVVDEENVLSMRRVADQVESGVDCQRDGK